MIVYTIIGTPISVIKTSHAGRKVLDSYNLTRFNHQHQLREQHDEQPFLQGLWEMTAEFYFDKTFVKSRGYTPNKPAISSLLKYLDDILHGVVYENEYVISRIYASKYYDAQEGKTILMLKKDGDGKEKR